MCRPSVIKASSSSNVRLIVNALVLQAINLEQATSLVLFIYLDGEFAFKTRGFRSDREPTQRGNDDQLQPMTNVQINLALDM